MFKYSWIFNRFCQGSPGSAGVVGEPGEAGFKVSLETLFLLIQSAFDSIYAKLLFNNWINSADSIRLAHIILSLSVIAI